MLRALQPSDQALPHVPSRDGIAFSALEAAADGFRLSVTDYAGHEDEVLRLRNLNRPVPETRAYLDWRYAGGDAACPPKIVWLTSESGAQVGMTGIVFRPFWADGIRIRTAVLGDISLDEAYRGRNLGRRLLEYVTRYLAEAFPDCLGFVIPTEAARRSLDAAGWTVGGKLLPYVLVLDPTEKLSKLMPAWLARPCARVLRAAYASYSRAQVGRQDKLCPTEITGADFDRLWAVRAKSGLVMGDRSCVSLAWRHAHHPHQACRILKLVRDERMVGYLVHAVSVDGHMCSIYDVAVESLKDLSSLLGLFAQACIEARGIANIRLVLSEAHPYTSALWKLGFIAREPQGVFQFFVPASAPKLDRLAWALSLGDKDI